MRFGTLVHAVALALLPAIAGAQPRPGGAPPPVGPTAPDAGGVEIAAGSIVVAIFPTVGGQVSIPASRRARLEFGTHLLPWLLEDGDDLGIVTQVQARIPFRHGPTGSRRSVLLGVSAFTTGNRWESVDDWHFHTALGPHAGVSWQWQKSRNMDVRIDLQAVVTAPTTPFVPFATFAMVWHRDRRWS
jgi:hypothetical protein